MLLINFCQNMLQMQTGCLQMCLRFVRSGYQYFVIIFFHWIVTTNTPLEVFIILTVKGRGNF